MHIEALKIFCDAVSHNSFSKAACENGLTQSAASQSIQKLEDHLRVKLIDRSHRPWTLTREGKVAFERSRDVLESFYRLEKEVKCQYRSHCNDIRVATIYSVGLAYMKGFLKAFDQAVADSRVWMEHLHPAHVLQKILEDEVDIGVMAFPPNRRELTVIPWCEERMVLACAPDHRLAKKVRPALTDLGVENFVTFDSDIVVGREIARQFKNRNIPFRVALRFDNIEAIKRAVEDSRYVALLPETTLTQEVATGTLSARVLKDNPMTRPLGILHRRGRELTPAMHTFVTMLQKTERP